MAEKHKRCFIASVNVTTGDGTYCLLLNTFQSVKQDAECVNTQFYIFDRRLLDQCQKEYDPDLLGHPSSCNRFKRYKFLSCK